MCNKDCANSRKVFELEHANSVLLGRIKEMCDINLELIQRLVVANHKLAKYCPQEMTPEEVHLQDIDGEFEDFCR